MSLRRPNERRGGFTFVELLMAVAIAAGVIGTAVISYQAVTQSSNRLGTYETVELPSETLTNLYGMAGDYVQTFFAPNYGRAAMAEILRENFYEDMQRASAVYCLNRDSHLAFRTAAIPIDPTFDARRLDSPEAFRQFLAAALPDSADVFTAYRGAAAGPNLSIFLLMPSATAGELSVRAIYEIDFVDAVKPAGVYASVRRYQGDVFTDYYDVFYPESVAQDSFSPLAVFFERRALQAKVEGPAIDRFKVAANRPFYFVWWPDPAYQGFALAAVGDYSSGDPRAVYAAMRNRTSLFFVAPAYPAL